MKYTTGNVYHGFEVTRVRRVEELSAECVEMRHVRTGAELVWFNSGAENKLFSIAFKTIPEDNTGVFHILEHSVLCGSENYPVKEPFVELLKSSLNTFLNAMTFPDKTMYPVSSRNERDFINLTRIYLDAVFKPAILSNPNIFYQEGWHYELTDADSQPRYKGVVFNEMKGSYSSVDRVVNEALTRELFTDNCYGLSSGGNPVHIPDLTYEQFIDTYRRYYHPSNSRIYLDGDLPVDEVLAIIDDEYLSGFDNAFPPVELAFQPPVESHESHIFYEIGADEDPEGKTQMIMGRVICDWQDREQQLAAFVLGDYLTASNDSPLKKALLEADVCEDATMTIDDGIAQQFIYLLVRNTSCEKRDIINDTITKTVSDLLTDGLDRLSLEAAINRLEFKLREGEEPMGLERAIYSLSSWLYGGDPLLYITQDEVFASLRAKLDTDYFERILSDFLLERRNTAVVWCEPSATLGQERLRDEHERIAKAASSWSAEDREKILALNRALEQWQQTPDTPENLNRIPVLSLSEVDPAPSERVTQVSKVNAVTVLNHPTSAKGITYFSLYFDISDIEQKDISTAALISGFFGKLPTDKHTVAELNREVKTHIGGLSFALKPFARQGETGATRLFFKVDCSVLDEKIENAIPLIIEELTETRFDLPENISVLVTQMYDRYRRALIGQGHMYALMRAISPYSADADTSERIAGYSFYEYVRSLTETEDKGAAHLREFAEDFVKKVFCSARLTLSVTSAAGSRVADIIDCLPEGSPSGCEVFRPVLASRRKECIRVPAAVSFAAMGINLGELEAEYSSELRLMAHIVSFHYLWNEIRVQGGAYGAGMTASNSGDVCYYTYRDPDSSRSLGVFRKTSAFLRAFCEEEGNLDKSIIGCISNLDPLVTVRECSGIADSDYFRGITYAERCRLWSDLLAADRQKLVRLCDILDGIAEKGSVCVIGGTDIVDACAEEQLQELRY